MHINGTGFDALSQVKKIGLDLEEQKSQSVDKMDYVKNLEKQVLLVTQRTQMEASSY